MKSGGITRRWVLNMLTIVVLLLVIFSITIMITVKNYYYSSVEMMLSSQYSDTVVSYFSSYIGSTEDVFENGAREYIENFSEKDSIGVWILDSDGNVVISSTGFDIDSADIPEYTIAKASKKRYAEYTGKTSTGEKVMSITYMLPQYEGQDTGAVRYMISLDSIDTQLIQVLILIILTSLLVICLVTISGLFFINSIVVPVREINDTAKKIAKGDLDARIEITDNHDEISELCETLNYMTTEISYTDKMRNDFISTVSHEMRTPLTAIKGWGETLLDIGDSDPALTKKGIEVIIDESSRLTGVVEDLLDLSRIVNGRLSMKKEKMDVLAELDDAVFVFKERSMRDGINLNYNAPHVPAPMEGDPGRIRQVFVNILDNAFKYTQQGGSIDVTAEIIPDNDDPKKCVLKIYTKDTGCGISEEDLPKVKEKFYKSNISVRGSGIGLAVCDEIMKLHDGTLDIESKLGEGTLVILGFNVDYIEIPDEPTVAILEEIKEGENNAENS